MCGIFGIVSKAEQQLGPTLIEAGHRLSYRGYDSVGCATIDSQGKIDLRKDAGKVDAVAKQLNFEEMTGVRAMLQLRWATFGEPSQVNSQPHLDSEGLMVGAHNGNVVNNVELREAFMAEGMTVRSTNDGESCVHAVERHVRQGMDMVTAIRHAYNDLQGDYAFVIARADEDCMYAFKKGSGLVAGIAEDAVVISSDLPSVLPFTRKIMRMEDGEIITFWHDRLELHDIDGNLIEREPEMIKESMEAAQKGGYAHFMEKEIHEEPKVAEELLNLLDGSADVEPMLERMRSARNLYFVGCGTSYNACMMGSVYFSRLTGRAAIPVLAPQFIAQFAPALGPDDVGIFVSQSGETKDVLNAIEVAKGKSASIFSLVNVIGSTLTKVSEYHLPMGCGYEISVPATKTFTNQVITFLYLAMRTGRQDKSTLRQLPALMEETIENSLPQIAKIEERIKDWDSLYCLGYGLSYPMALEGALKIKEITYAHCEGMLSTEFKHGPLAAVTDGYPILFAVAPEDVPLILSGINEVTCRGGWAIAVGEDDPRLRANAHDVITIPPSTPEIAALLAVLPLQLLSYRMSLLRGFDPDFPRNLSKTLTVD